MATTLAEVLQRLGGQYLERYALSAACARAWRAIVACRTPMLGGQRWHCQACGTERWRWHSCRNRHCPRCQKPAQDSWRRARGAELLVVPYAQMKVFAGKFRAGLQTAEDSGYLPRDLANRHRRRERMRRLRAATWVVYAKTALAAPAALLDYLSGYMHRTASGAERVREIQGTQMLLRVRANDAAASGGKTVVRIKAVEFITRFLEHVLPSGFKRIRHYGVLAWAHKAQRLAAARRALAIPASQPVAAQCAALFMRRITRIDIECCPCCRVRWGVVQTAPPDLAALSAVRARPLRRTPTPQGRW